jgi:hypothetical protein
MLARLLPAIAAARNPSIALADVYIPAAIDPLEDGSAWVPDVYQAQPCLEPGAQPCQKGSPPTPIEGWSVHPYGLPGYVNEGIDSLPGFRRTVLSGRDNIIASEIGFCASDVAGGASCKQNQSDAVASGSQAASLLTRTLADAYQMHKQGWLRAVIVWARSYPYAPAGTGWAMQNPDGSLTAQGAALVQFADGSSSGP